MTKLIIAMVLTLTAIQADVVHYDKKKGSKKEMTKPNHPSVDLYR